MFSEVFEDRQGPDRGTLIAEAVVRNLSTQERITFTLGSSSMRLITNFEQNFRRAIT